ncbi:hypothetical protein BJ508DRAFT_310598 [Ascobolus immersus RN42]|uniref:Uncharacterized protein n=1 Tax=Ascobolus immersus RN42 TaxID=1160509 RepID=A0A3N4HYC5_ASCIM|nr:hypothetical protein BJ508DRAFT_310598 [Ascobolus immersus RN42]
MYHSVISPYFRASSTQTFEICCFRSPAYLHTCSPKHSTGDTTFLKNDRQRNPNQGISQLPSPSIPQLTSHQQKPTSFMPTTRIRWSQLPMEKQGYLEFCEDQQAERAEAFMGPYGSSDEATEHCEDYIQKVSEDYPDSWDDTTDEEEPFEEDSEPESKWFAEVCDTDKQEEKQLRALDAMGCSRSSSYPRRRRPKSIFGQGELEVPGSTSYSTLSFSGCASDTNPIGPLRRRAENESLEDYIKAETMHFIRYMIDYYLESNPKLKWNPLLRDRMDFLTTPRVWKRICRELKISNEEYVKYLQ